jgi:hypothetical protein
MTIVRGVTITSSVLPGRQRSASMMSPLATRPDPSTRRRS